MFPTAQGSIGGRLRKHWKKWLPISPYWAHQFRTGLRLTYVDVHRLNSRRLWKGERIIPFVPASTQMDSKIQELLIKDVLEEGPVNLFHRFFLVPKKDGGARPILAMLDLNPELPKKYFRAEDLQTVSQLLQKGDWMIVVDVKGAYHHIPMHEGSRKLMGFRYRGKNYRYAVAPMGLSPSPRWWTNILTTALKTFRIQGVRMIAFYDDILLLHQNREELVEITQKMIIHLHQLGIIIAKEKSMSSPKQQVEYLGVIICSRTMRWHIPNKKVHQIIRNIQQIASRSQSKVRIIAKVVGQIQAAAIAMTDIRRKLGPLYLMLKRIVAAFQWNGMAQISIVERTTLWNWIPLLKISNGAEIRPIKRQIDLHIWTDASLTGWGFTDQYGRTGAGGFTIQQQHFHINILEAIAVWHAISALPLKMNSKIHLHVDNMVLMYALRKEYSTRSRILNVWIQKIHDFLRWKDIQLVITWISTSDNGEADRLSRSYDKSDWKLAPKWFQIITQKWGPRTIDLFATALNKQTSRFFSKDLQPGSAGINALHQNWSREIAPYANPPWKLIMQVLLKIQEEQKEIVLVVPEWTSAPWWPLILRRMRGSPVIIGPKERAYCPLSQGNQIPSKAPQWKTWIILIGHQ